MRNRTIVLAAGSILAVLSVVRLPTFARLVLAFLAVAGCGGGDSGGTTGPPPVDNSPATITLSPTGALTIQSGASATLTATVTSKSGGSLGTAGVVWTSADPTIASVAGGVVTGAKVGSTTISASIGTISATALVTVTPGAAVTLAIRTQPVGAVIGATLATQPVIEIRDAAGNVVPTSTPNVTATIASGGGTLGGTSSVAAVGGVATFSGLSISGTAGDRTLAFTSTGLATATSSVFTMVPPPTPIISIDNSSVSFTAPKGSNPTPVRVNITNTGALPLIGLTLDPIAYDPGQASGWLTATLNTTTAPAAVTLSVAALTLGEGTYHAVLHINGPGAPNSPAVVSVTLNVIPAFIVVFGTSLEKVKVVDVGASFAPTLSLPNPDGSQATGVNLAYTSRSSSVATVAADGRITAKATGDAWIVASSPFSSDSVFVIVPQSAAGPLIRTNITTWSTRVGDTAFVTVLLDTRSTPVGAAVLAVDVEVSGSLIPTTPTGPPVPIVTLTTSGVFRIVVGAAAGMTGSVSVLQLKLTSRTATSGFIYLYGLDLSGVDGTDLTPMTTSTRLPIVFR